MSSPTMLVSLDGDIWSEPVTNDGGVVLMMNGVVEVAAGVAVARGQRELRAAIGIIAVAEVLAVEGDALGVGDHRRAAAEEDQAILVGRERQPAAPRLMISVSVALIVLDSLPARLMNCCLVPGAMPSSTSCTVLALSVWGRSAR